MSETANPIVAVEKLSLNDKALFEVTLRVKPDRRVQQQLSFPQALERRLSQQAERLVEMGILSRGMSR